MIKRLVVMIGLVFCGQLVWANSLVSDVSKQAAPVQNASQETASLENAGSKKQAGQSQSKPINKIIYGSCIHQDHEQPIWKVINQEQADLFVFLGDNIYGDTRDMDVLKSKYEKLGSNKGFQTLKDNTPIVATWDDHDFGENDTGRDYPFKEASRKIMLDFFDEPQTSKRRTRDSGIYTAYYYGEEGKKVQLLLLDLRWNRTAPLEQPWYEFIVTSFLDNKGPYSPNFDPKATILGDAQWQWLENELKKPADVRIIASSLQVLPETSGWEAWASFPKERERLFNLIKTTGANGAFFISGDTHWSEFSQVENQGAYPLWELTSSGLTEEWKMVSPNPHRVGEFYNEANYGVIDIQWEPQLEIRLSIKDVNGQVQLQQTLKSELLSH